MGHTAFQAPTRDIRPREVPDAGVGQQLIRIAQEGNKQWSVLMGKWEMLITFFKHGMEIPLCLDPSNISLRENHKYLLLGAMGVGEVLARQTKNVPEKELKSIGYSHAFLKANIRYLHDTYQQWYVERDTAAVEAAFRKICDGPNKTTARNPRA